MSVDDEKARELLVSMCQIQSKLAKCNKDTPQARHVDLLRQLETVCHRLAESEELARIRTTIQQALDSGLIDVPVATEDQGECPLCFEEIPNTFPASSCPRRSTNFLRFYCCGAIACTKCMDQREQRMIRTLAQIQSSPDDSHQIEEFRTELATMSLCPFCRSPNHGEEHWVSHIRRNAEAGKTWAQYKLGQMMAEGWIGNTGNPWGAVEWLELAADAGDCMAMIKLYKLWGRGFPEVGIPADKEKSMAYVQRAARRGHWLAQYNYAVTLDDSDPVAARLWYTLSAAQGFATAQRELGMQQGEFHLAESSKPKSRQEPEWRRNSAIFKGVYWLKKAALQGEKDAHFHLPFFLLKTKGLLFNGQVDLVGSSVVPEACFWFDLAADEMRRLGVERPAPLQILLQCACCRQRASGTVKVQRCAKCQGVGYCGRDCQIKHWKLGHKRDCQTVQDCQTALIMPSKDGYPYPVRISSP